MLCSICGSETHFRAECPNNTDAPTGLASQAFNAYHGPGPLGDLLSENIASTSSHFIGVTQHAQQPSTPIVNQAARQYHAEGQWGTFEQATVASSGPLFGEIPVPPPSLLFGDTALPTFGGNTAPTSLLFGDQTLPNMGGSMFGSVTPAPTHVRDPDTDVSSMPVPEDQPNVSTNAYSDLGQLLQARTSFVNNVLMQSTPQPTIPMDRLEPIDGSIGDFSRLAALRREFSTREASRMPEHAQIHPWQHLTSAPGLATVGMPAAAADTDQFQSLPSEFQNYAADMIELQRQRHAQVMTARRARRQRIANAMAAQFRDTGLIPDTDTSQHTAESNDGVVCAICTEAALDGDTLSVLVCQHTYHSVCIDTWVGHHDGATCPQCRMPIQVIGTSVYHIPTDTQEYNIATPPELPSPAVSNASSAFHSPLGSFVSTLPWWPTDAAESQSYHALTQLPNGRLSFIVDPGAWTNLIGAKLARKLCARALAAGHAPGQERMQTLNVQGVGNGSQACNFKMRFFCLRKART